MRLDFKLFKPDPYMGHYAQPFSNQNQTLESIRQRFYKTGGRSQRKNRTNPYRPIPIRTDPHRTVPTNRYGDPWYGPLGRKYINLNHGGLFFDKEVRLKDMGYLVEH